jgi:hypothetical protein
MLADIQNVAALINAQHASTRLENLIFSGLNHECSHLHSTHRSP